MREARPASLTPLPSPSYVPERDLSHLIARTVSLGTAVMVEYTPLNGGEIVEVSEITFKQTSWYGKVTFNLV